MTYCDYGSMVDEAVVNIMRCRQGGGEQQAEPAGADGRDVGGGYDVWGGRCDCTAVIFWLGDIAPKMVQEEG